MGEIRFRRLFETAKDGIVVVDVDSGIVQDVNPRFGTLTGYAREELEGKSIDEVGRLLDSPQIAAVITSTRQSDIVRHDELAVKRKDQRLAHVDIVANSYTVGPQPVVQLNVRDVSPRREAARALRESEERFRLFVESVSDYAMFQIDRAGRILTWNAGAERLLGWAEAEAVGKDVSMLFVPEDVIRGEPEREIETARRTGRAEDERWHKRKDGSRFFASGVLTQLRDEEANLLGFAKIMRDITARKEQEDQLRRSVEEKSTLVREIHHRVKNNLQVIVSLLSLQSNYTDDPKTLAAFEETQGRVQAIARIHERLYASDDLAEVEFGSYLANLTEELVALHAAADRVSCQINVEDLVLNIEQAIPLGLIANEIILNSLKHGLGDGTGTLTVLLSYVPGSYDVNAGQTADDGWAQVSVRDTGPGLPTGFDPFRTSSLGFRLITLLARQLTGRLQIGDGPGTVITVGFPLRVGAGERSPG